MNATVSLPSRSGAFSLIELTVVLAVLAVVTSLATPSFSELIQSWRLRTEAVQMISAIWLARATALRLGQKTVLCPIQGTRCGGQYQEGFGIFSEEGILLRQYQSRPESSVSNRGGTRSATQALVWSAAGLGSRNMTFLFCAENTEVNWAVVLNRVGRPRLRRGWGVCPD
ncbi:MAG: GspH/FimT family pseudopilin [Luminiphilus sp.]|nr:GspH/FimT family pseudopilin [Luminiphilus sp.]